MKSRKLETNYQEIPGDFKKVEKELHYVFPMLHKQSSRDNDLEWTMHMLVPKTKTPKNLYTAVPKGATVDYWSVSVEKGESGGKPKISNRTSITAGKNIGKANETNVFTQALSQCYSKWQNKIKTGYSKTKCATNTMVRRPPMLLYRYDKFKHKVVYPAYVQVKRDGILYSMHSNSGKAEIYSRNKLVFTNTQRQERELQVIFDKYPELELYGEAYKHGESLQVISGIVRDEKEKIKNKLEIYIFDCVPPGAKRDDKGYALTPYAKRWKFLKKLFEEFPNMKYIKNVKTYKVENEKEMMKYYKQFMKDGYEGAIYRNPAGIYKYSTSTSRSWEVLKIKPRKSAEFKIAGFKDGNGKNAGLVTFIMATEDGKKFNAEPNMTEEIRRKLFTEFQKDMNKNKTFSYKDKMATIEYSELSDRGVPQQPKFIAVRDYE